MTRVAERGSAAALGAALLSGAVALSGGACTPAGTAVGAAATLGVTAAQERGIQGALDDSRIRLELNHLLLQEDEALYRHVNLQIQERRVLITGNVAVPEDRITLTRLAWQVPGVREVINETRVSDRSSLTSFARDRLITGELEARLLLDREILSINFSIETQNQVIYLLGVARDRAELERVVGHAKTIAYVRRVVDHVRLRDRPLGATGAGPT